MKTTYDVVVIGAGSGGLTAAVGFAKVGKRVLLVEREHLGGECTNSGCIPSKALLHHAKTYHQSATLAGTTQATEEYRTEAFTYVRSKIDEVLAEETPADFEKYGITVLMGEAVFVAPCSLQVNDVTYTYKTAVIATGSRPRMVDVPGLATEDTLTNQNIFNLSTIPERTLVIGSGPIGLELGQALALLGSEVTIATIDTEFARLEDPAIRPILRQQFESLGIKLELRAFIQKVEENVAFFDRKDGDEVTDTFEVPFDKTLVAIGRVPNIPSSLDAATIKTNEYGITVDSQYRTSNKYVYALGDVSQRLKFTHTADDTARQVVAHVISRGLLRVNKQKAVPKVTYTLPEVAQVGLSWNQATQKFDEASLMRIEVPFTHSDRAKTDDDTSGLLVVVVRRLNGVVLGAHIIGPAAGEIISVFTLAIDQKISMWKLRSLIFAYPTYSLVVKKAGDQFFARQIKELKADLKRTLKRHVSKIIALVFWISLIYAFQSYRIENDLSYSDVLLSLIDFFTSTLWGPVIYMFLYAVRPLILFPATLLTALSGMLFGFWWGILYTIIGENASANFAYWIGRFFGKDMKLEDSIIGNWVEALRARPFGTVLFMRLFYMPFDLTNYGSGILKIKWSSYFTATLIGIMPGLTTFVALGAALDLEQFSANGLTFDAFDPRFLALSVAIFIGSLGLSRLLKRWHAEK
jgi:pyruvate/2-oxoglutarate dehydrogenase complex dihydrolipoamide dehydrogenase (E3) component/membrane protein DedA with SNARE-associated domain